MRWGKRICLFLGFGDEFLSSLSLGAGSDFLGDFFAKFLLVVVVGGRRRKRASSFHFFDNASVEVVARVRGLLEDVLLGASDDPERSVRVFVLALERVVGAREERVGVALGGAVLAGDDARRRVAPGVSPLDDSEVDDGRQLRD